MLLIPDLLGYWLTGEAVTERTNASTTGLLDVRTGEWDDDADRASSACPDRFLGPLVDPGDHGRAAAARRGRRGRRAGPDRSSPSGRTTPPRPSSACR